MKFGEEIIRFDFGGIPMVGNLSTGYAIGLTSDGAQVCDTLLVNDLEESDIVAVDAMLYQHLCMGGFFDSRQPDNTLKSAYFHVTQRCNLDCVGCYSDNEQRNALQDAPLESLKHAIHELSRAGVINLVISGGEPFLRPDLADLVIYAKSECGIASVNILSNGTCLDKRQLEKMADYVDRVSVSFDGCSPESTAYIRKRQRFTELVEAVKTIQDTGIQSHIIATIHRKNFVDMAQYQALAEELGVTLSMSLLSCSAESEGLGELTPDDNTLRDLGKTLLELGADRFTILDAPVSLNLTVKQNCGAGRKIVSVAADGTVYPCHMLHSDKLAMGNLFTGSIEEVLHGEGAMCFNDLAVHSFDECKSCDFEWICGGGCRARAFTATGNLESKDSYCSMITEFYSGLGEKLNAMYVS